MNVYKKVAKTDYVNNFIKLVNPYFNSRSIEEKEIERKRSIVCTFDDGYSTLVQNVVPILEKYHFCATVFINTNMIGKGQNQYIINYKVFPYKKIYETA